MLNSDVDFNPRLREGGDGFYWSKHCKRCLISIHASAKEATLGSTVVKIYLAFQSTPPRRRRLWGQPLSKYILHFNPRLREGGDSIEELKQYAQGISIHASAKEATIIKYCISIKLFYFNPRLREGGDQLQKGENIVMYISIHASAKEATATYCDTSAIMYISSLNNFFVHFF